MASILLLDRDGVHLRHGASPSLPKEYTDAIVGLEIGPSVGSCGTAAFTAKTVIVTDIATDPLWANFRHLALSHGLRACWSTPIISSTARVLGTFAIYYSETGSPDAAYQDLIHLLTHPAAVVIERQLEFDDRLAAEQALLRANQDLEQFAFSVSHDLQESVRSVALFGEILRKRYSTQLDEDGIRVLTFMTDGARRMELLVKDLPTYTQTTAAAEDQVSRTDSKEALAQALSNLSEVVVDAAAQVSSGPLPRIRMRPVHLQQLFQNLIGNAIKYRSEAPPLSRISAERVDIHWRFSIEDNGIGINSKYWKPSSASLNACTPERNTRARESAWPSAAGLSSATAAAYGSNLNPAKDRPSSSPCRNNSTPRQSAKKEENEKGSAQDTLVRIKGRHV